MYGYAYNNPVGLVDSDGLIPNKGGWFGKRFGAGLAGKPWIRNDWIKLNSKGTWVYTKTGKAIDSVKSWRPSGFCSSATPAKIPKFRNKPPGPDPEAKGLPHSIIEKNGYTTHYGDGTMKQLRLKGKNHGPIDRPNVKYNEWNNTPVGPKLGKYKVRKDTPEDYHAK